MVWRIRCGWRNWWSRRSRRSDVFAICIPTTLDSDIIVAESSASGGGIISTRRCIASFAPTTLAVCGCCLHCQSSKNGTPHCYCPDYQQKLNQNKLSQHSQQHVEMKYFMPIKFDCLLSHLHNNAYACIFATLFVNVSFSF